VERSDVALRPWRLGALLGAALLTASVSAVDGVAPRFYDDDPLHEDPETQDASGVKEIDLSEQYDFIENSFFDAGKQTDQRAVNLNTIDHVPNSSWYTQRLGTAEVLSVQDVIRGPYRGQPPQPGAWTIVGAKSEGISPGMTMRDSTGTLYFVKFDPPSNPEMATGAEVISTRLFWALGFNVPENYLASFRREDLRIAPNTMLDDEHGRRRAMNDADVDALLQKAARKADGGYRVVASEGIAGKDVGPFRYYGTRPDDPNDIHPHEHRRELRGMRVFAAWLNHDDSRAINTRDFLQDQGTRKIVRHYLLDFGSTLGSGSTRAQGTRAGNEYIWETRPTLISMITLGFYVRPWLKVHYPDLPAVGRIEANYFNQERWKPEYPNPAFDNSWPEDLFWGAHCVMAFSNETILEVSRTAEFSDPEATAYMAQTLITRRDKIGQLWLNVVLPADDFDLTPDGVLTFRNIAVETKTATPGRGYKVAWARFDNATGMATAVGEPQIVSEARATAPREALSGAFVQATLTGDHPTHTGWATPTTVVFRRAGTAWTLVGVDRQSATIAK
jgi:hypothetical protein